MSLPPTEQPTAARPGLVTRIRKPDWVEVRRLSPSTPILFVWIILVGIAAFQIFNDPLGFSRLTQRYSQDLVNLTVTGPLYSNVGRDRVSVALMSDESLAALGMTWPIAYGEHARLLDALLAYGPRAVAVDILLTDERDDPSLEQLLTVIDRYETAGVPLYFVGDARLPKPVRDELANSKAHIVDGKILIDDGVARQYPLSVACLDGEELPDCPSFAVRIYQDLYQRNVDRAGGAASNIELVWGTGTHPTNRKWMRVEDDDGQRVACPDDVGILWRAFYAVVDVSRLRGKCPHTGVIPAESLLRGDEDADVEALARNRIVFYGGELQATEDKAFTPSNGLLAGVFVHAMATDNLVTFAGRPKRDTITLFGVTLSKDEIETIIIGAILLVMTMLQIKRLRALSAAAPGEEGELKQTHRLAWYVVLLSMILSAGVSLYAIFGLSVGNWVELVFISGLLFEFLISPFLPHIWGRIRYALGA